MATPSKVVLLTIYHRHGEDRSVYTSTCAAMLALYAYVMTWWHEAFTGEEFRPKEPRKQEAIEAYFAQMPDETYTVTTHRVDDLETVMQTHFPESGGEWLWIKKLEDEMEACTHDDQ